MPEPITTFVVEPFYPIAVAIALSLWAKLSFFVSRDTWNKEYDYIIVGGGSSGSVIANRLSEDHGSTVLLLEAGGFENVYSRMPLATPSLQDTSIDWRFRTQRQKSACFGYTDGRCHWTQGKVLGGTSSLNYMLYVRGNKRDFNNWEAMGAEGWSYRHVLPYFLKSEDNLELEEFGTYHSSGGFLTASRARFVTPLGPAFVEAGEHLGYPHGDYNGETQAVFNIPQGTIRYGSRLSSARAFIQPIKDRSNLHILVSSFATKILFDDNKRAIGVEFDRKRESHTVFARKEIIISGGTIGSPKLLLLSGVGPREDLEELDIPIVADLPVGRNLQDHICAGSVTFTINASITYHLSRMLAPETLAEYLTKKTGLLTSLVAVEGIGFVKTKYANKKIDWPDVQIFMISGSVSSDDGHVYRFGQGISEQMWQQVFKPYKGREMFTLYPSLLRPKSRGYIGLKSTDPYDPPIIDPKYYSHPHDLKVMVDAMKIAIKVGTAPSFRKFGSEIIETLVPGCEHLIYLSDEYLACAAQTYSQTIYHFGGTCRMRSRTDSRSVVDPQLRVLGGITGLRVADTSIMPQLVSSNTNAAAIMIGEKVSDMIRGKRLEPIIKY